VRVTARRALLISIAVVVAACGASASAKKRVACFDATPDHTSPQARALFEARHCQGGGVTWAAILEALARRHGKARFTVDDEADAARFCSDDAQLLAAVRRDYATVNRDAGELRRVMAQASADELECFAADGTAPPLPKMNPVPALPAGELASTREKQERFKHAIAQQPVWCFPPDDPEDRKGVLRFAADGTATLSGGDGKVVQRGRWQLPPPQSGDSRAEVVLQGAKGGTLLHLDVGPTGRLGELIPGSECLRAR
jgi:hypothetical protein